MSNSTKFNLLIALSFIGFWTCNYFKPKKVIDEIVVDNIHIPRKPCINVVNEMFGTDVNPKTNKIFVGVNCPNEEIEKFKSQGYEVVVDDKMHLRDFWRKDEYKRFNTKHLRSFTKKIIDKRIKDFKKVKYKGIRYI